MVYYSKGHYEDIADIVKKNINNYLVRNAVCRAFSNKFKEEEKFDENKFMQSCGVDD